MVSTGPLRLHKTTQTGPQTYHSQNGHHKHHRMCTSQSIGVNNSCSLCVQQHLFQHSQHLSLFGFGPVREFWFQIIKNFKMCNWKSQPSENEHHIQILNLSLTSHQIVMKLFHIRFSPKFFLEVSRSLGLRSPDVTAQCRCSLSHRFRPAQIVRYVRWSLDLLSEKFTTCRCPLTAPFYRYKMYSNIFIDNLPDQWQMLPSSVQWPTSPLDFPLIRMSDSLKVYLFVSVLMSSLCLSSCSWVRPLVHQSGILYVYVCISVSQSLCLPFLPPL